MDLLRRSRRSSTSPPSLPCQSFILIHSSGRAKGLPTGRPFRIWSIPTYFFKLLHSLNGDGQAVEGDEARAVGLIVDRILAEGGDLLIVEGVGAGHARAGDVALVELDLDRAGDRLLCLIDEGGERLAQRGVPEAVVDQIGKVQRQLLLHVLSVLVQAELLEHLMGEVGMAPPGVSYTPRLFMPTRRFSTMSRMPTRACRPAG